MSSYSSERCQLQLKMGQVTRVDENALYWLENRNIHQSFCLRIVCLYLSEEFEFEYVWKQGQYQVNIY